MCLQWITLTAECHTRAQFIFCSTLTHELFRCRSWYVGTQFVCVVCLRRRTLLSAITGAFLPDLICRWAVEYGSFHCPSNQARITGVLQCGFFYYRETCKIHPQLPYTLLYFHMVLSCLIERWDESWHSVFWWHFSRHNQASPQAWNSCWQTGWMRLKWNISLWE